MSSNKILRFFAIVIAALAIIGLLIPEGGFTLFGLHFRYPSIQSIVSDHRTDDPDLTAPTAPPVLEAMQDTLCYLRNQTDSSDLRFWLPAPHYFDDFWLAAGEAKSQKRTIRVLHYGDSQIEMDHITSRLRAYMQRTFGGGGPGMLPFRPVTPPVSVRQNTHGQLAHLASFGDSLTIRSRGNYGPMMQSFRLEGGEATATVKSATGARVDDAVKQFSRVKLIANNRNGLKAEFTDLNDKAHTATRSASGQGIVSLDWQADSITDAFRLHVSGNADLYAILADADSGGIAVDNIPMRGCSGQQFTLVGEDFLAASYRQMDIGLIILQFGGNSVPYIKTADQISTYCKSLGKQIDHIHRCCPTAKILFIGPSDMSKRQHGEIQTYPMLPSLVDSLIATANAHGAAYWSIYHAMGGLNSMPVWARQGLAGKDYVHFSQKGADLMGDRLAEAFANSYNLYRMEKRLEKQREKVASEQPKAKKKSGNHQKRKQRKGGRR